jgi:hypothetical protein
MSDELQREFDRVLERLKEAHPSYNYSQLESRLAAHISSEMSKFRHRVNNPNQYTDIRYDPDGKLRVKEKDPIEDKNVVFFSSRIPNC